MRRMWYVAAYFAGVLSLAGLEAFAVWLIILKDR